MSETCQSIIMEIIENSLELSPGTLKVDSCSEDIENWDSLGHLSILVALDKNFAGKVSGLSEMAEANSVQKILKILHDNSLC